MVFGATSKSDQRSTDLLMPFMLQASSFLFLQLLAQRGNTINADIRISGTTGGAGGVSLHFKPPVLLGGAPWHSPKAKTMLSANESFVDTFFALSDTHLFGQYNYYGGPGAAPFVVSNDSGRSWHHSDLVCLAEGEYVIQCRFQSKRAQRYIRLQLFTYTLRLKSAFNDILAWG